MLLRIVSIVVPICLIVMIGFAYGRKRRPDMAAAKTLIFGNASALLFIPLALALRL
jgi:cbb3-type cytochrome oxidase subunit 3